MDSTDDGSTHRRESSANISSPLWTEVTGWRPCLRAFHKYKDEKAPSRPRRLIVGRPIAVKLTKDILETYQTCNPSFQYSEEFYPKLYLTNPSVAVSNGGLDNENFDLILAVDGVLINREANHRYVIKELLGQGTFGQVVKCWADCKDCFVAVKVIKNQPAYHQQAIVELQILNLLNCKCDPEDKHHIVRIFEYFIYQDHLCIVFEMLGVNLYELLKRNHFKGISLKLIQIFTKQILTALSVLRDASVIHCDLKPENILLTTRPESAELKLIDFGSACMEHRTVYSYIQSRFYRSPEVVLGHQYTSAIDMWSFGCVAAELFLGLPLFPAQSQYDLLQRMIKILGAKPPDHILRNAKNLSKYFKHIGAPTRYSDSAGEGLRSAYQFLNPEEFKARENVTPTIGKHYFPEDWSLEQIISNYHLRKGLSTEEIERETRTRFVFIDFIHGLVNFDPLKRWTPHQAARHPFITEEPFDGSFQPPPEPPRMCQPVYHAMTVDHNPGHGHWLGAGLSPQVNAHASFHVSSPRYTGLPYSYGSSFGSTGSFGSLGDGTGAGYGSSYGSHGDALGSFVNRQTHSVVLNTGFGISPDTRRRVSNMTHNSALSGHAHMGFIPSNTSFIPMPLGGSPSNFTPPSSHFQHSPGSPSTGSPSRYGPTSPARSGGSGAAAMGKAAALGQYKRRGYNSPGPSVKVPSENPFFGSGHHSSSVGAHESCSTSHIEGNLSSPMCSPRNASQFKQKIGTVSGIGASLQGQSSKLVNVGISLGGSVSKFQAVPNRGEETSPPPNLGDWDPSNWDPYYSEELLIDNDIGESTFSSGSGVVAGEPLGSPRTQQITQDLGRGVHHVAYSGSQVGSQSVRRNNMVPIHTENFHAMHGHMSRPLHHSHALHHSHFPQQMSPSRLGQHPVQYLSLQQHQHQWGYRYPLVVQREHAIEHLQVMQPGLHTTINTNYDVGKGNGYSLEQPQGAHLYAAQWAERLQAQRVMNTSEHLSGTWT